jgi:outer membrane protein assembly factor BamB
MARLWISLSAIVLIAGLAASSTHQSVRAASQDENAPPTRDWLRFGWDVGRSSAVTMPTGIDAGNVGSLRKQVVRIDGTVDSSPIYLHGVRVSGRTRDVFFVTTSYGRTLAIDADNGATLWEYTPSGYRSWAGSYRVTTATPVADPDRKSIYAAAPDGRIRKLSVADGHVLWSTAITRLPTREKIASALNEFRGHVIATTGGYIGDEPPYQGHVVILDGASGKLLHVWNSLCSDRAQLLNPRDCPESDSAIWGRAGAVIDESVGDIFVATGNARWDGKKYWGDAVIQLTSDATHIIGNYTPTNTQQLNVTDADLGSTSPVLLGGDYIAQGGKDGKIRVLSLPRISGTEPHRGGELQVVPTPSGTDLFTAPAVWHGERATWMFAADDGGTMAWTFSDGRLQQVWKNNHGGTSPLVAGGLLYIYDPRGGLRVYDPESGKPVAVLDCGSGHWNSPIVIDGRIALPEGDSNDHATSGVLNIWRTSGARSSGGLQR